MFKTSNHETGTKRRKGIVSVLCADKNLKLTQFL